MASGYPDFEGPKVKVYLTPEWAAKEGTDKNLNGSASAVSFGAGKWIYYAVPAGKTLYVTSVQAGAYADAAADGDSNQICLLSVARGGASIAWGVGNGGVVLPLSKPIVLDAGEVFWLGCHSYANHDVDVVVSAQGYEVSS